MHHIGSYILMARRPVTRSHYLLDFSNWYTESTSLLDRRNSHYETKIVYNASVYRRISVTLPRPQVEEEKSVNGRSYLREFEKTTEKRL